MIQKTWRIHTGRKSIEVERAGEVSTFSYDVVEMKLLAEELEIKHGMRKPDTNKVLGPTIDFLKDYAAALDHLGISGCTSDTAFRFYNLIGTQFVLMTNELQSQCESIAKG
jgi:hypothetical protein